MNGLRVVLGNSLGFPLVLLSSILTYNILKRKGKATFKLEIESHHVAGVASNGV